MTSVIPYIYLNKENTAEAAIEEREVNDMKKGLTEVVFILDRSGSMRGLENDTIGGYNSMLEKQQKEEGDAVISTILFDGVTEILHDRKDLKKMEPITEKDYYVRGNTALLDALGSTIHRIGKLQKAAPEDEKPEKTLFIITTDGRGIFSPSFRLTPSKLRADSESRQAARLTTSVTLQELNSTMMFSPEL